MACRLGCGACCIAPSMSSAIPGMPRGKAANIPCIQLDAQMRCKLFNSPLRPAVCTHLQPTLAMCGDHRDQALSFLCRLEQATRP